MCEWGTDIPVKVKISADLSCDGKEKWREFGVDACIAPIVKALQDAGIDMRGSCCGHGKCEGNIELADGRYLLIFSGKQHQEYISRDYLYKDAIALLY